MGHLCTKPQVAPPTPPHASLGNLPVPAVPTQPPCPTVNAAPALDRSSCRSEITLCSTTLNEHEESQDTKEPSTPHAWISSSCWHDSPRGLVFRGLMLERESGADSDSIDDGDDASDTEADLVLRTEEHDDRVLLFSQRVIAFERRAQLNGFLSPVHQVLQSNDPVTAMPMLTLTPNFDPFESLCETDDDNESESEHIDVGHPCVPTPTRRAPPTSTGDIDIQCL